MMRDLMRQFIVQSLLCGAAQYFCPDGQVKHVIAILSAAILSITILTPLREIDVDLYSLTEAKLNTAQAEITQNGRTSDELLRRIATEDTCNRYLLGKANAFGLTNVDVSVKLRKNEEGSWIPESVRIRSEKNAEAEEKLGTLIQSELGIPRERQEWVTDE